MEKHREERRGDREGDWEGGMRLEGWVGALPPQGMLGTYRIPTTHLDQ